MSINRSQLFPPPLLMQGVAVVLALLVSVGCARQAPRATETQLLGYSEPLLEVISHCSALSDSQVSAACGALADRIRACSAVQSVCVSEEAGCSLIDNLQCLDPDALEEQGFERGTWRLTGPLPEVVGAGAYLLESAAKPDAVSAGSPLDLDLALQLDPPGTAIDWLPASTERGFGLNVNDAFLRFRYQPRGGLAFQRRGELTLADRLYGLRSELFSAAVLHGDVELAMLVPQVGAQFPGLVIALDFKLKSPAVAAMESYIDDLQREWPITRRKVTIGGYDGACLSNLRVMPGLAPCYVATESAIVVGWNQEILGSVLPYEPNDAVDGNRLTVDLDRLAVADRRIAEKRGRVSAFTYPGGRLSLVPALDASRSKWDFHFQIRHSRTATDATIEGSVDQ